MVRVWGRVMNFENKSGSFYENWCESLEKWWVFIYAFLDLEISFLNVLRCLHFS